MNRKIKLGIIFISILFILGLLTALSYVVFAINKLEGQLITHRNYQYETYDIHFEEGSILLSRHFDFIKSLLKVDKQSLTESNEHMSFEKDKIFINNDLSFNTSFKNDCQRYRCLQSIINFNQIPSNLWKGLIGVEDYRFLDHAGVDLIAILRAVVADLKAMSFVQGGSTLTQQLAKNLYLSNEKKFERKLRELIYAIYLEKKLEKEEIISVYFNEVFWGVLGGVYIKGVEMASVLYFDKPAREIDTMESIILISLLKGPQFYSPLKHIDRLKTRVKAVTQRLREINLIDSSFIPWSEDKWDTWQKKLIKKNESSDAYSLYMASKNPSRYLNLYERFVFSDAFNSTYKLYKERLNDLDLASKAIIIDKNCFNSGDCTNDFTFYSKLERDLEESIFNERHQVGSILKPIVYGQILEFDYNLNDVVSTEKVNLMLNSGKWSPKDSAVDREYISLKEAIQKSKNNPLVRLVRDIGFDKIEKELLEFFPELLTPLEQYPAQLLGSIELSLSMVADSYLKFMRRECSKHELNEQEFEDSLIYTLTQAPETTISRVSNQYIRESLIFGKTGTTNKGADNWYVASDGESLFVIWFGVDSKRDGKDTGIYGSTSAFKIFQNFVSYRGKKLGDFYCL